MSYLPGYGRLARRKAVELLMKQTTLDKPKGAKSFQLAPNEPRTALHNRHTIA